MGLNSMQSVFRRRASAGQPAGILPYFGVGPVVSQANKTAALILALPSRGPTADRSNLAFTLDTEDNLHTMYYAYPVSYGQAIFLDVSAGYEGGWDGAHGDFGQTLGPITVNVTVSGVVVPFYLYQTDYPNLGSVLWRVY